jgi:hypothetical protein
VIIGLSQKVEVIEDVQKEKNTTYESLKSSESSRKEIHITIEKSVTSVREMSKKNSEREQTLITENKGLNAELTVRNET